MRVRKQGKARTVARYIAGRPLDGYPRSNATWYRRGTEPAPGEHPGRWSMLPGWQRTAYRLGIPAAAAAQAAGLLVDQGATLAVDATTAAGLGAYGAYRIRREVRHWRHRRQYVGPLHRTLGRELGVAHATPDRWLAVPVDYAREGADPVRITLPADVRISDDLRRAIKQVVEQKLGLHDPTVSYSTIGRSPVVTFKPAPRPPARVRWEDVAEAFRAAPEVAPVLGIGCRNTLVSADFDADSPHVAISAGSGAGKSILARNVLAHALHHGAGVVVLDYKRSSQRVFEGLPGVVIAKNIDDIHNWACALGIECERRNLAADIPGGFVGHRIVLLVEEWNALAVKLAKYWDAIREHDQPKRSPAVEAISDITFMGRHIRMNVLGVAQMLTARTTGGPETRENFGTRCLGRYTKNAWNMLVPEVQPMPPKSKTVGRWQIVMAGEAYETQVAYLDDDQTREWATTGVAAPDSVLASYNPDPQAKHPGTVPGTQSTATTRLAPISSKLATEGICAGALVGLRDAVDSGLLAGTLDANRKRAQRDNKFPAPADTSGPENLYHPDQLADYQTRRNAVSIVKESA